MKIKRKSFPTRRNKTGYDNQWTRLTERKKGMLSERQRYDRFDLAFKETILTVLGEDWLELKKNGSNNHGRLRQWSR